MSEQSWNFHGIESGAGTIQRSVQTTEKLLDDGKSSLSRLADAWGGAGSEAYQGVQRNWDATSGELNAALKNLAARITEAGQSMSQTESGVQKMFGQ
jgi:6 kDa early secretory antigenic target